MDFYSDKDWKRLVALVNRAGFKVVTNRKISDSVPAMGLYDPYEKRIHVLRGFRPNGKPMTTEDMIFVLAHEFRHVQHEKLGLYGNYYKSNLREGIAPNILVGISAERDCDRYAREYLKSIGRYSTLMHRKYPVRKVYGYLYCKYVKKYGHDNALMAVRHGKAYIEALDYVRKVMGRDNGN